MSDAFPPMNDAAEARLQNFLGRAARDYAASRNYAQPPGDESSTSCLSPYIARRVLTEWDIVRAVLDQHSWSAAEKYIQEICWRTYSKGWLMMRPEVWTRYLAELEQGKEQARNDDGLRHRLDQAMAGRTGIDCFDAWASELTKVGYLHNHVRMWFASIWIFTLELPWTLGADFFYRHLLDADPASNTLGWRWVAGLHTRGKHYIARASNIEKYTNGAFSPEGRLNESPDPLTEEAPVPKPHAPEWPDTEPPARDAGYVASIEDLYPPREKSSYPVIAILRSRSDGHQSETVQSFNDAILRQASERLNAPLLDAEDLPAWAEKNGLRSIIIPQPMTGYYEQTTAHLQDLCGPAGLKIHPVMRPWDRALFPQATAGYFRFKKHLKTIVTDVLKNP